MQNNNIRIELLSTEQKELSQSSFEIFSEFVKEQEIDIELDLNNQMFDKACKDLVNLIENYTNNTVLLEPESTLEENEDLIDNKIINLEIDYLSHKIDSISDPWNSNTSEEINFDNQFKTSREILRRQKTIINLTQTFMGAVTDVSVNFGNTAVVESEFEILHNTKLEINDRQAILGYFMDILNQCGISIAQEHINIESNLIVNQLDSLPNEKPSRRSVDTLYEVTSEITNNFGDIRGNDNWHELILKITDYIDIDSNKQFRFLLDNNFKVIIYTLSERMNITKFQIDSVMNLLSPESWNK